MDGATRISGRDRIAQLDVLRGIAILGILFMNLPYIAGYASFELADPRWLGWTAADQWGFGLIYMLDGTMRGLLQMLFGAGLMIMARHAMTPDAPVRIADIWARRNLWLIAFGLFNVFVLMWAGDILLSYGIAALFLFPFRKLKPATQFAIGAAILAFLAMKGMDDYHDRQAVIAAAGAAEAKQAAGTPLAAPERDAIEKWRQVQADYRLPPPPEVRKKMDEERALRQQGLAGNRQFAIDSWFRFFVGKYWLFFIVVESFATMLIGAALYQWGVIQGRRPARLYWALLALGYGFGGGIRLVALQHVTAFTPYPDVVSYILEPFTRELVVLGHLALVTLLLKAGVRALRPFEAAGKLPISIYFTAAIFSHLIFADFGLGQWGKHGAGAQVLIAFAIMAVQLAAANLWLRRYETGPCEWLWKSLAYAERQPFGRGRLPAAAHRPAAAE